MTPIIDFIFNHPVINKAPASLLVLGTSHHIDLFCDDIISLYKKHDYEYIIVSGYKGEAQTFAHNLEGLGIPKSKLLLEHHARNTPDNFRLSLPIIQKNAIQNLHIMGKLYAMPRIKLTAAVYLAELDGIRFIPVDLHDVNAQNWASNLLFLHKIHSEFIKIRKYIDKGDIAPYQPYFSDADYDSFMQFMETSAIANLK